MSDPSATPPPNNDEAHRVPRATTPTWEAELLLSAGMVFGLMQAPSGLDDIFDRLRPVLRPSLLEILWFFHIYGKVLVFALVSTFLVHLAARGVWTAVLGLRSVFPDGVRWDKLRNGPNYIAVTKPRVPALDELVERVDNFASILFAFGAVMVMLALVSILMMLAFSATASAISSLLLDGKYASIIFWSMFGVTIVPMSLANFIDQRFGKRLPPEHPVSRVLRGTFRYTNFFMPLGLINPLMLTYMSNVGHRKGLVLLLGGLYAMIGLATLDSLAHRGGLNLSGATYVMTADSSAVGAWPQHYADQRDGARRFSAAPFIESAVVEGPYLRLFIPYIMDRHSAAVARACPDLQTAEDKDEQRERARQAMALACLAKVLDIHLDAQPVGPEQMVFARDGVSDFYGVVAMLPMRDVAPGRHEIMITKPSRVESSALIGSRESEPDPPYRIVFWR